ncbi:MAG: 1,4-dihydroxy-2-naphthoate octaprenyltransferase [candidate division FCPU426 bacterium]
MSKLKAYLLELRAPFLTVSILPVAVGTAAAFYRNRNVEWLDFILVLATFVFLHLGANVWNDYWDDRNGTDRVNGEFVFPFTGGSRLLQQGLLRPGEVWGLGAVMYAAALITGGMLAARHGYGLWAVWLAGMLSGAFYTAPPFKWVHKGWGEFLVGFSFGPLPVATAYFIQTGRLDPWLLLLSLPLGFLAAAILFINQFPDYRADKASGKHHWVVRLGRANARWLFFGLLAAAYAALAFLPATGAGLRLLWMAFIGLPLAVLALKVLWANHSDSSKLAPACISTIALHLVTTLALCGVLIFS